MYVEYYLILARSVTFAQRMQRALDRAGIRSRAARAPRDLAGLGCAYVLRVAASDLPPAMSAIRGEGLGPVQIFMYQNGGYREVGV